MKLWLSKSVDLDKKKKFPILEKVEKKLSFSAGKKKNFLFQESWESEKGGKKENEKSPGKRKKKRKKKKVEKVFSCPSLVESKRELLLFKKRLVEIQKELIWADSFVRLNGHLEMGLMLFLLYFSWQDF